MLPTLQCCIQSGAFMVLLEDEAVRFRLIVGFLVFDVVGEQGMVLATLLVAVVVVIV